MIKVSGNSNDPNSGCGCGGSGSSDDKIYIDGSKVCYVINGDSCCIDISSFTKDIKSSCKKNISIPAKGNAILNMQAEKYNFLLAYTSSTPISWKHIIGNHLDTKALRYDYSLTFDAESFNNNRINLVGSLKLTSNNDFVNTTWGNISSQLGGSIGSTWSTLLKSWNSYSQVSLTNLTPQPNIVIDLVGSLDQDDQYNFNGALSGSIEIDGVTYKVSASITGKYPDSLAISDLTLEVSGGFEGKLLEISNKSFSFAFDTTNKSVSVTSVGELYSDSIEEYLLMDKMLLLSNYGNQSIKDIKFYNPSDKDASISLIVAG